MSNKFNIGDVVRRIEYSYGGMNVGDEAEVIGYNDFGNVKLDKFDGGHAEDNLELVETINTAFKVGVVVKLEYYMEYHDHKSHDGQSAVIIEATRKSIEIMWQDKTTSTVNFNEKSNPYIVNKELKDDKMDVDINDVKNFDKDVIKKAKVNVLEARKEMQTKQAEAILTGLLDVQDTIEEKIGEDQEVLNSVKEDIKVFDVK